MSDSADVAEKKSLPVSDASCHDNTPTHQNPSSRTRLTHTSICRRNKEWRQSSHFSYPDNEYRSTNVTGCYRPEQDVELPRPRSPLQAHLHFFVCSSFTPCDDPIKEKAIPSARSVRVLHAILRRVWTNTFKFCEPESVGRDPFVVSSSTRCDR